MVKDLAKYLRTILLKKSDEQLGLGLPNGLEEPGASREGLYGVFEWFKKRFKDCEPEWSKLNFNFKPGKGRVRRRAGGDSGGPANRRQRIR